MIHRQSAARSDLGRTRQHNADSHFADDVLGLYVVSDGMSDDPAGRDASAAAIAAVEKSIRAQAGLIESVVSGDSPKKKLISVVEQAIGSACASVYELSNTKPEHSGLGCTLTVVLIASGYAAIGHVGDSRLYLFRADTSIQLTSDHTVAADLIEAGRLLPSEIHTLPHPDVLSRCVGNQPAVKVDSVVIELLPDDRLLLCSDGFSDHLRESDDLHADLKDLDVEVIAEKLVDRANFAGGTDNITVIVVECSADDAVRSSSSSIVERYSALRSVFLFEELGLALLSRVMAACKIEEHAAGETVIELGQPIHELIVIVDGRCNLTRGGEVVATLEVGGFAGMATLLHSRPARAEMIAETDCQLLRLSGKSLVRLIRERPWLGIGLLERLGRRLSGDLEESYSQRTRFDHASLSGERL